MNTPVAPPVNHSSLMATNRRISATAMVESEKYGPRRLKVSHPQK